jgi:putative lipoprotein
VPARGIHLTLALLPALLLGTATNAHAEDQWWGSDKALHFGVSGVLAGTGYAAGSLLVEPRWQRAGIGAGVALTAGVAKEVYDELDYGGASYKDLVFDVAGTVVGVAAAWLIDIALDDEGNAAPTATGNAGLAFSF